MNFLALLLVSPFAILMIATVLKIVDRKTRTKKVEVEDKLLGIYLELAVVVYLFLIGVILIKK